MSQQLPAPTPAPSRGHWVMAAALIGLLAVALAPLPTFLFDLLLGASLLVAALTFLVAFYVDRPADFSAFPSLLLFVTLFRLALGVASTRLILTGDSPDAAGDVIAAFGDVVIGGNFLVGTILFLILVTVNFIVITKGAERIAEVAARFTLDSLPGKQLAVDAELSAGLITETTARARRAAIQREADFHGAMDGAAKFVRGDAIASLLILAINAAGGIVIGVVQRGLSLADAAATFTLLSVGEGLAAQIPALLVSTGAALLVTRSDDEPLGAALGHQLLDQRRPLAAAAALLFAVGLLPGMPHLLFFALAAAVAWAASRATPTRARLAAAATTAAPAPSPAHPHAATPAASSPGSLAAAAHPSHAATPHRTSSPALAPAPAEGQRSELEAMLPVDLLGLEVGLDLLGLVDSSRGGDLLRRITALRKQIAQDLGVLVPPIQIRDDLQLRPGGYRITLSGVPLSSAEVLIHRVLAIDPQGDALTDLAGPSVTEPTFGLPAKWLLPGDRRRAEAAGATVVEPAAVIATHLGEQIRRHAAELLGRREAQELLDIAARQHRTVIDELLPHHISLGELIKVLRNLLREGVAIRDMRTILEALADHAPAIKDPEELTELVRQRLHRRLSRDHLSADGTLRPLVIDPRAEALLRDPSPRTAPALARLGDELAAWTRELTSREEPPLVVVAPELRRAVSRLAARHAPGLAVLSTREVDVSLPFSTRAVIAAPEAA
jgi:flagellar biosynthesis protein FlhA